MKPLFTMNGQVINVFVSPKGVNKQGEEYGGQDKVQIIGDIILEGGQSKKEMITLTTSQGEQLKKAVGQSVTAPVAFFSNKGSIGYYIPKGSQISLSGSSQAK